MRNARRRDWHRRDPATFPADEKAVNWHDVHSTVEQIEAQGRRGLALIGDISQQADITRCGGVTAFLQIAALCQAHNVPLSGHTAPALHTHAACAVTPFKNLEYFHDHVRLERMFFDGLPQLVGGELRPDLSRAGTGLELKRADAEKFAA